MNLNSYNYSYTTKVAIALTDPLYKLYKTDIKYIESNPRKDLAERVFEAVNMLLINIVAFPISFPLWCIGRTILQYTSPKCNYSPLLTNLDLSIKANLLNMVKDYKESIILEVFSHGPWYSLYDYRVEPIRTFSCIPGLESPRHTSSVVEKIHSFLEQQMIFTRLKNSNSLVEAIQKTLNKKIGDTTVKPDSISMDPTAFTSHISRFRLLRSQNPDTPFIELMDITRKIYNKTESSEPTISGKQAIDNGTETVLSFDNYVYSNCLIDLVSREHNFSLEESISFVGKNFYSGNDLTYQGVNCLLRGVGALS